MNQHKVDNKSNNTERNYAEQKPELLGYWGLYVQKIKIFMNTQIKFYIRSSVYLIALVS